MPWPPSYTRLSNSNDDAVDTAFPPRVHRHTVVAADLTASPMTIALSPAAYSVGLQISVDGFPSQTSPESYTVNAAGTQVTLTNALRDLLTVGKVVTINYYEAV